MSTNIALPIRRFFEQHLVATREQGPRRSRISTFLIFDSAVRTLYTFMGKAIRSEPALCGRRP